MDKSTQKSGSNRAVTLVHKGAMEIAVHAVSSFARHFSASCHLEIHTDGTPDAADEGKLLEAAGAIKAKIVRPEDRAAGLRSALAAYPQLLQYFDRGGYFSKLQLAVTVPPPFFYFDSDIVWLRPVENLASSIAPNSFSTESWSWYFGVRRDAVWVRERIARRVNSGFYHVSTDFPVERLARLFGDELYTPDHRYSTDQEMMAFLYPDMEYYHPDDLKRSRRGVVYDLMNDQAAALHFPGGMWADHLDQIRDLGRTEGRPAVRVRFQPAVPLTRAELWRMRATLAVAATPALHGPIDWFRRARAQLGKGG